MKRANLILLYLASVLFFGAWWPLYTARVRPQNDHWSDALETNALVNAKGGSSAGPTNLGLFLPEKNGSVAELLEIKPVDSYKSAFGLQGYLAVWTWKLLGQPALPTTVKILRVLYSCLFAALLVPFVWSFRKLYGPTGFAAAALLLPTSLFISNFGRSLHWQGWLIFLPFVVGWLYYPKAVERGKTKLLWIVVTICIVLRALVGYEFLSNIAVALMIRPALYHFEKGDLNVSWKKFATAAIAATAIGFVGAMTIHIVALSPEVGGPIAAIQHIKNRATDRMSDKLSGGDAEYAAKVSPDHYSTATTVKRYASDFGPYMIPTGLALPLGLIFTLALIGPAKRKDKNAQKDLIALGLGATATLSWVVLMRNHMIIGSVHNPIIFFLPFYFLLVAVIGRRLETAIQCERFATDSPS